MWFVHAQVMKLGGLEILDGWLDGDVEVYKASACMHARLQHAARRPGHSPSRMPQFVTKPDIGA